MITAAIVIGSIISYIFIGLVVCRPALSPLYGMLDSTERIYRPGTPDQVMRQVTLAYSGMVLIWPLSILWVVCWLFTRSRTPQYREHLDSVERKRLEKELKEAQQTITEFTTRQQPVPPPPPQRFNR
jgi:hypothetical protein